MKQQTLRQLALFIFLAATVDAERYRYHRNSGGGDSSSKAGNSVRAAYRLSNINASGATLNIGVQAAQQGGQAISRRDIEVDFELVGRDSTDIYDTQAVDLAAREAQFNGGHARGGNTKSRSGLRKSSAMSIEGITIGEGGRVDASTVVQQMGGNSQSGQGGTNYGNGGKGGSLGIGFGKRDLLDESVQESYRVGRRDYLETQTDIDLLLRRQFNGGNANGGDSTSNAGERASSNFKVKNITLGKNAVMDLRSMTQQNGGNSVSGNGGTNAGSGGGGGSLSFDFKMPGMPKLPFGRRELLDEITDELVARKLDEEDILWSLHARDIDTDSWDA